MTRIRLLVVCGSLSACCGAEDRPPPAAACTGNCAVGTPRNPGSSGNGGEVDAGGSGEEDAGAVTTVAGAVEVMENEQFIARAAFAGEGLVGGGSPSERVSGEFSGATYQLAGVLRDADVWMDVQATATTLDVLTTIQRVDSTAPPVDLAFVRSATVEGIGAGLLTPIELRSDRAHAVVRFVDASGQGVRGVTVTAPAGEAIAYDTGAGLFRDDQPETTESGLAIILNAQAIPFPGGATGLSYAATSSGATDVKLAQGAVTLLTVRVN
jgi:hypothetical protein